MSLLERRLQAFFEITKKGTVLSAAKSLGYTQTALTQRIRSLEEELRTTLFIRSRRGMELTPEGAALLRYCQAACELEGAVFSRLAPSSAVPEIHLTLAVPTSGVASRFVQGSARVMKKHPGLFVHHLIDDLVNRVDLVRTGRAQLALVSPEQVPREMESKRLAPNRYRLVGCREWKARPLDDILRKERMIDFYESDQTTLNYLRKYRLAAKAGRARLYVNHNLPMVELLRAGIGFGTLTEETAAPHLKSGELVTLHPGKLEEPLAMIWYPRPQMPAYFQAVVDAID